jgi:tight adherence protein C
MTPILVLGTLGVAGGVFAVVVGLGRSAAGSRAGADAVDAILDEGAALAGPGYAEPFIVRLLGPASDVFERAVRAVTPSWWLRRMRRNATMAGLGRLGSEGAIALKGVYAIAGAMLMSLLAAAMGTTATGTTVWAVIGAVVGFVAPDVWVAHRAEARQEEIRRTLPETLDLLAISVGAGMGLEQAIELVSRRLPGALGEELHRMLQEVQLGVSRREALHHLRERTEVTELGTFALALAQADALGSPLSDVLKTQAGEMRNMRRQRAREQAAKLPVKLLFPLLAGIFPALVIVVVGPAVVQIAKAFSM